MARSAACVLFIILRRWVVASRLSNLLILSTTILLRSLCILIICLVDFTPLESPAIHGGDGKDNVDIPFKKGRV